ncbi:hypothetical protein H7J07_04580 [Mycobacterium koreense]|uniref:Uncharacterized protein n=1 Tax=Mycolicibacillus koreensis TaxID=1069220 RepID=A0A7I7SC88_9MYCO|nr:hypothetical protein [Mycolicibacillus koreensis]MCV7247532.1 hypothetical protein [Mycolicibacillus koreensis]ODR06923.1 hypothetical protein BHQ15_12215 [Mycolicibacillus koreensis]OSC34591.1 hypothetical protein B8W67_06375 [Mycolicibacillus koreensis]BBY53909.1 hypothetical protein MKOR_11600 [Mycolicibacillus koreensis]
MSGGTAVAVAITFVWLGMVAGIAFIESPLKFRAPNVTLQIGLGIGRLVFRALNTVEGIFAGVLVVLVIVTPPATPIMVAFAVAMTMLLLQLAAVRPRLNKRSDQVLAGYEGPRSHAHYVYVGLELIKLTALLIAGSLLLAG